MKYGSYNIDISNRDKIYFPGRNITKGDLIEYYEKISDYLLPFLQDRPLTLSRFPDGIEGEGFYQKEVPDYFPSWIEVEEIKKKEGGTIRQVVCNTEATLIYLVNQGTLSFHPWLSTTADIKKPNKLVFDLDPPKDDFEVVIKGAKALRLLLEDELDLNAFVMTTGSEGLHVVCPIRAQKGFDEVRTFAKDVAEYLVQKQPDDFTVEMRKKERKNRLFIDYIRNAYGQTSIPPYSVRALEGAPIATPLKWKELGKKGLTSQYYHIKNIFRRLAQSDDDPWSNFRQKATGIDNSREKLEEVLTKSAKSA